MNLDQIESGVRLIIEGIGADLTAEGLEGTPARVAKMFAELSNPTPFNPTTFENQEGYDQLVVVKDIPFYSLCEHHLIPFFGTATVGYLPQARYVGLSKLARCVEYFSRSLQVQERLTTQIAGWVESNLDPIGVGVIIKARHLCMEMRGIQKQGAETVTSAMLGALLDSPEARAEFLSLIS